MKKCLFISLAFASTIALSFMGCNNSANINEEDLQTIPSSKIGLKDIDSYWHLKEKLYVVHKICIVESLPTADSAQIAEDAINRDEDATYDLFESVNTTIPYQRITTKDKNGTVLVDGFLNKISDDKKNLIYSITPFGFESIVLGMLYHERGVEGKYFYKDLTSEYQYNYPKVTSVKLYNYFENQ